MLIAVCSIFSGYALLASGFWVWSELRDKFRYKKLKKQAVQEGTALVDYKPEISRLRAVRDIYAMQE